MQPLLQLGADEIIPEEFETSVEIFTRVLAKYLVPRESIERFVAEIRATGYEMFRTLRTTSASLSDLPHYVSGLEIAAIHVDPSFSAVGQTLAALNWRKRFGITVLAIRRAGEVLTALTGETVLEPGDELYLLGRPDQIAQITASKSHDDESHSGNSSIVLE